MPVSGNDPRHLLVRADIFATGLWIDGMCVDAEDLPPLPPELVRRIEAWAKWHDDLDRANSTFSNPFYWEQRADAPRAAFNAEGEAITAALRAALPADWSVHHTTVDAWLRSPAGR